MTKILLGLCLGFTIGFACRWIGIPSPAPPVLPGALLVVAMTAGFMIADRVSKHRVHTTKSLCGGPTGRPASQTNIEEAL